MVGAGVPIKIKNKIVSKTMQNKYKVEIHVTHIEWLFAENEEDAKEKAETKVFGEKVNERKGDLITGYKVIPLRADADMIKEKLGEFI